MSKLRACIKTSSLSPSFLPPSISADTTTTSKSFNSTINRLSAAGSHQAVLSTFISMLDSNTPPDAHTYPNILKACASLNLLPLGRSCHQQIIVNGYSSDPYISSSLINFYCKSGLLRNAHYVFDVMTERNVVACTSLIGSYSRSGEVDAAFHMYNLMRYEGIKPSSVTMLSLLSGVSELPLVESVHGSAIVSGLDCDVNLGNCFVHLYGKCGKVESARKTFEAMDRRDTVSWNSLVSSCARSCYVEEILRILKRMRIEGMMPDKQTFAATLMAVVEPSHRCDYELGRLVHGQIVVYGLEIDAHLATLLLGFYLKVGNFEYAFRVFEMVQEKDMILWTAMISGLVQNDCADKALMVFDEMLRSGASPSTDTIATVLSACAQICSIDLGTSVHGYLLRQRIPVDVPVQNALVTMYAKCGHLKRGAIIFKHMHARDVVSWNAIIAGYSQNGDLSQALVLFNEMRLITHLQPNSITIVSLLQACASTGALQQGKCIHNVVTKTFLQPCIKVDTALVDMYLKCGDLDTARICFERMLKQDVVSWSTIIAGFGSHSRGEVALRLFSDFLRSGIQPNHVIFLSVLFACSHNGLVAEGLNLFRSMVDDFGIKPELEHCACVVDLLCRAGRLEEAYDFVKAAVSEPTVEVLGIILDACRAKGNIKLAELVLTDINMLQHVSAEKYVQLAHSYAAMNRWTEVGNAWLQMKSLGLKKVPGWSYIEQHGKITTFFMDHSFHAEYEEIMWVLEVLGCEMLDLRRSSKRIGLQSVI